MTAIQELQAANQDFVNAMRGMSCLAMEEVWSRDERVVCVHPGYSPLIGWVKVRSAWIRIFQNVKIDDVACQVRACQVAHSVGIVSSQIKMWVSSPFPPKETPVVRRLLWVNIFCRYDGGWRCTLHQARLESDKRIIDFEGGVLLQGASV